MRDEWTAFVFPSRPRRGTRDDRALPLAPIRSVFEILPTIDGSPASASRGDCQARHRNYEGWFRVNLPQNQPRKRQRSSSYTNRAPREWRRRTPTTAAPATAKPASTSDDGSGTVMQSWAKIPLSSTGAPNPCSSSERI